MASSLFSRSFSSKTLITTLLSRTFSISSPSSRHSFSSLLRPLSAAFSSPIRLPPSLSLKSFSTRTASSSLNDPSPNWSNRPPKETILLDGCDFEHWLVVMEKPEGEPTRDEIIDSYIKTLAKVVGSEDEARMKIYSVSTRCYFAFGALVSEELSYKLKELPGVRWVLPDSYLDVKNKDYGGEPFINGQAVPYDPKYHEEWIRNNARANERNKRNSDRPRNFDRSRNFERRRENLQNRTSQAPPPPPNNYGPPPANNYGPPPSNNFGPSPPSNSMGGPPQGNPMGGPPQNNYGLPPPGNPMVGPPPAQNNYMGRPPPPQNNYMGGPPPPPPHNNYMGGPPPPPHNYVGGPPNMGRQPPNMGGPPPNMGGMPSNAGWNNNNMQQNFQNRPDDGSMQYEGAPQNYRNSYGPGRDGN